MVFRNHANGRIPCPACGRMVLAVGHPVKRYRVHHTPHPKYAYRPSGKECPAGGHSVLRTMFVAEVDSPNVKWYGEYMKVTGANP